MKTLGLIGGTTWVSTIDYYKTINSLTNERLGGDNTAKLLLYSLNFEDLRKLAQTDNFEQIARNLIIIARKLEKAGAECLLLCANTLHLVAKEIQDEIDIPILHIAETTAKEIIEQKIKKVALLGTKVTMEKPFYKNILSLYNIKTIIPDVINREYINDSIFNELGKDIFKNETRQKYLEIIKQLEMEGAEGVVLGCTEIPMLIKKEDCQIPTFDTLQIHAKYAVNFALSDI
jgi:aspartate racemase